MSSSASEAIPHIIESVRKNRPDVMSVLDVGFGFGKLGYLFREYFESKKIGRHKPGDWVLKIDGIDIYDGYLSNIQKPIYNNLYIDDVFKVLPRLGEYDVAILSDVIEHFTKEDGYKLIDELFKHVKDIVIATPKGFTKQENQDNPNQDHLSGWELADFKNYNVLEKYLIPRIRKNEEIVFVYLRK